MIAAVTVIAGVKTIDMHRTDTIATKILIETVAGRWMVIDIRGVDPMMMTATTETIIVIATITIEFMINSMMKYMTDNSKREMKEIPMMRRTYSKRNMGTQSGILIVVATMGL
jgi:hypothetical protein